METGISRRLNTGRLSVLSPNAHLEQSISDILTTPLGTRVMRPDYGSALPHLIDEPMNKSWKLRVYAAAAAALDKWEPRIRLDKVSVASVSAGKAEIMLGYTILETGKTADIAVTVIRGVL